MGILMHSNFEHTDSNGNTWNYEYVPSTKMFSTTDKSIMNSQMKSLYRYYGKQIYY